MKPGEAGRLARDLVTLLNYQSSQVEQNHCPTVSHAMTTTTDLLSLIQSFRIIGRNRLDDAFDWLERKAGALEEVTRFHFTTGHNLKDQPEVRIHIMLNTRAEAMRWGSMHLPEFTEINGRYFECVLPNLTVLLHPMENLR